METEKELIPKGTKLFCENGHHVCEAGKDFIAGCTALEESIFVNYQKRQKPLQNGDPILGICGICGSFWFAVECSNNKIWLNSKWWF